MLRFSVIFFICFFSCLQQVSAQEDPLLLASDSVFVLINDIKIYGNNKTLDKVILAESKISQGDSISLSTLAESLKESRQNILNTRLFNDVKIRLAGYNGFDVDINITVNERWYIYPIPIFQTPGLSFSEWRTETNSDFDRVAYGIKISHQNHRKRAEKAELNFKTGFERQAGLKYGFTGFGKERRIGAGIGFSRAKRKGAVINANDNFVSSKLYEDDVVDLTGVGASVRFRQSLNTTHSLAYSFLNVKVDDVILADSPQYFANSNTSQNNHALAYGLHIEHRDLIEYPLEGYSFNTGIGYEGINAKDLDIFTLQSTVNVYEKLSTKIFGAAQFKGRVLSGSEIPFYNAVRKRLDDDAIRGYEDYRIFPQSYVNMQAELKYELVNRKFEKVPILPKYFEPLPLRIYPKVFFDMGRTFNRDFAENNPLNDDFLYSIGAGVDIITIYNIPLRTEFSHNHLGENNLSFGLGKTF